MQLLIEYIGRHTYLAAGLVVAAMVVAVYEVRNRVQAVAALSSMQAVRLMNQGALVIDLRGKEQFDSGHINDARSVPVAELEAQAEALKKWRDKNVIAYCGDGRDGAQAVRTLTKLGFSKAFHLEGGLNGWIKDNMPLAKSAGVPAGGRPTPVKNNKA
jgi:rhodanese-related sulfurtransferase